MTKTKTGTNNKSNTNAKTNVEFKYSEKFWNSPKYTKINDINLAYYEKGEGDVVLLLHGLGGAAVNFKRNIDSLSRKHRVIALDLPTFGRSEVPDVSKLNPEQASYSFFTNYVKKFLDELNINKLTLLGHSMGGGVSLDFSLKYPDRVKNLILVSSSGLGNQVSVINIIGHNKIVSSKLSSLSLKDELIEKGAKFMATNSDLLDEDQILGYKHWRMKDHVIDVMTVLSPNFLGVKGQRQIFTTKLNELRMPVLIVWGLNDRILPVRHARRTYEAIPQSELFIFEKCGHVPILEKYNEFNTCVLGFLCKHEVSQRIFVWCCNQWSSNRR